MADETLLDKGELNIPLNLDNLKLYGVNSEQNTDGRVNASLLAQALGGQTGNVPTTNRGDLPNVAFTATDDPQPLIDALNALPLTGVPHGWIGMFSTVRITATSSTSFIADKRFYRFGQPLPGNSDANFTYYGEGSGTLLSTSNMKFIRDEQLIITAENGVITGTGAYDLGDIGTTSVADVVNGSTNTYTESNGIILLTATDGTTEQFYIYNGSENVIGNGGNAVTDNDFTVVDPANSVPAANDVYVMGGQLQNLVIEGVQNEVTSVELLATAFKTEEGNVIQGDNIPKYFSNFEVTSTGIRATLLRRVKLDSAFRVDRFCENATKLDDVQGFVTSFGFQGFLNNTNIQEIILPSVKGSTQNVIQGNTALTKLVVPKVDEISTVGCTGLTYLDARSARIVGDLSGSPLTDYLNIDSAEDLSFNNNFNNCQRTEINLNNLIRIASGNITRYSLIEVFRSPLLESLSGSTFRYDTKIKELRYPNLLEVNPEGVTAHTFAMEAIELIEAPKCKVFGSDTVVNQMFLDTDLSNCKIVVNDHLKTSNNGGINANIQDAIDKGATVVFAKDYAEEIDVSELLDAELGIKDINTLALGKVLIEASIGGWDETFREIGNLLEAPNGDLILVYSAYSGAYTGNNTRLGIAISKNGGLSFQKSGVNLDGKIGEFEGEDPYIIFYQNKYIIYYEAKQSVGTAGIGCISSEDLISWTDEGVVLQSSNVNTWENTDVSAPTPIVIDDEVHLYYRGRGQSSGGAIGLVKSSSYNSFTRQNSTPIISGSEAQGAIEWAAFLVPNDVITVNGSKYITFHGWNGSTFAVGIVFSVDDENWSDYLGSFIKYGETNNLGDGACFSNMLMDTDFITIPRPVNTEIRAVRLARDLPFKKYIQKQKDKSVDFTITNLDNNATLFTNANCTIDPNTITFPQSFESYIVNESDTSKDIICVESSGWTYSINNEAPVLNGVFSLLGKKNCIVIRKRGTKTIKILGDVE